MSTEGFSLEFTGDIERFRRFLSPTLWTGNLEREIKKATIKNALFLNKKVKDLINSNEYEDNSEMTLALKGSDKPLIDKTNLWKAIDQVIYDSFRAEVGIIRNAGSTGSKLGKAKSAINIKDLVELMESGYTIKVTEKMRRAIAMTLQNDKKDGKVSDKARVSLERLSSKRNQGSKTYVVPARPLLSKVFTDPEVGKVLVHNWRVALEGAWLAQGAKDGEHKDKGNKGNPRPDAKPKRKYTKRDTSYWSKKGKK